MPFVILLRNHISTIWNCYLTGSVTLCLRRSETWSISDGHNGTFIVQGIVTACAPAYNLQADTRLLGWIDSKRKLLGLRIRTCLVPAISLYWVIVGQLSFRNIQLKKKSGQNDRVSTRTFITKPWMELFGWNDVCTIQNQVWLCLHSQCSIPQCRW